MSDRLTEALFRGHGKDPLGDLAVVFDAAREHVSCGQGETIRWCPVHRAPEAASEQAGVCWYYDGGDECRMVEAVLAVKGEQ